MTDANEALRALDEMNRAVLPDPHDERDVSGPWLAEQWRKLEPILRNHLTDPGYVRVPVEPTDEMLAAGREALRNDKADSMLYTRKAAIAYRAMLAEATKDTSHD